MERDFKVDRIGRTPMFLLSNPTLAKALLSSLALLGLALLAAAVVYLMAGV